jgi:hypothetical protein
MDDFQIMRGRVGADTQLYPFNYTYDQQIILFAMDDCNILR